MTSEPSSAAMEREITYEMIKVAVAIYDRAFMKDNAIRRDAMELALKAALAIAPKQLLISKLVNLSRKSVVEDAQATIETLTRERDEAREAQKTTRNDALEEAAKLIEEGFDRGIARKVDWCPHDKFAWEDCEQCAASAIRALITEEPTP